ncbi:hypothetical protein V2G26_014999 [Clonostachys chloroleuca]
MICHNETFPPTAVSQKKLLDVLRLGFDVAELVCPYSLAGCDGTCDETSRRDACAAAGGRAGGAELFCLPASSLVSPARSTRRTNLASAGAPKRRGPYMP